MKSLLKKINLLIGLLVLSMSFSTLQADITKGTNMKTTEEKISELWDKQEITEVIYKFARALDRVDGDLMKSTYWEEAIEEHQDPIFPDLFAWNDNAHAFVPIAMKGFEALEISQHRISNVLIELDGDTAKAEAYVYAYHVAKDEEGIEHEGILGGRHLFNFVKKGDVWKIQHRNTLFDWNRNNKATAIWSEKFEDKYRGQRNKTDDSYNYLKR